MLFEMSSDHEQAKAAAEKADTVFGGNYVTEPGAYPGVIKSMELRSFPTGAKAISITTTTDDNKELSVLLWVVSKAGKNTYIDKKTNKETPLPDCNLVLGSLMPCLRLRKLEPRVVDDPKNPGKKITIYPATIGKPLGMLVNIDITNGTGKNAGKKYKNAMVETFFDPKTNLLGSEIMNKVTEPKKKAETEKKLKVNDKTGGDKAKPESLFEDPASVAGSGVDTYVDSVTSSEGDGSDFWN